MPYVFVAYGVVISFPGFDWLGSVARLTGIPALFVWLLTALVNGSIRRPALLHWLFGAFVLWTGLTFFWTTSPDDTQHRFYRLTLAFGTSLLIWDVVRTRKEVDTLFQTVVLSCYAIAVSIAYNAHVGNASLEDRFSAFGLYPNDIPKMVGMAMPMAWYLALESTNKNVFLKVVNYMYPIVGVFTIILTGSRGGLVACIPAFLFVILTFHKTAPHVKAAAAIATFGALLIAARLDFSKQLDRFATIGSSLSNSGDKLNGRFDIWSVAWDLASKHPWAGIGAGAFPHEMVRYGGPRLAAGLGLVAHNTYLSVLTETGIIGLLLFLAIIFNGLRDVLKHRGLLRFALGASLITWAAGVFVSAWEETAQTWLMFTILAVSAGALVITKQEQEQAEAEAVEEDALSQADPVAAFSAG